MVLVKIGRQGGGVIEYALNEGTFLVSLLEMSNIDYDESDVITKNGVVCDHLEVALSQGDVIIVQKRQAPKSFDQEPFHSKLAIAIWNIAHAPDIKIAEKIAEKYQNLFYK